MEDNNKEKNQYKKLGKDTLIFAISNFSSKILVFLLLPLYTSFLSTEEYGIVDLINNIVTILFPILTFSIIEGILRFSYDKDVKKNEIISIALGSIIFSSLFLCAATPIAYIIGKDIWRNWGWILLVFSGYCLSTTVSYYLRGINQSRFVAIHGVVQTILTVLGNIIFLVVLRFGMSGYVLSIIISYYTTSIFMIVYTKIYKDFKSFWINVALLRDMMSYCIPMIPSKIAWWMNNSLDKYYIIFFRGLGSSGLYSVAHKIPSILSVFTEIFNQAWQISAIEIYTNKTGQEDMYSKVHTYYIYFSTLCASILIMASQLLGKLLFAKDFFVAWKYVPILIIAAVFSGLSGFYHSIFRAAKMSKQLGITVIFGTVLNIIFNTILVPSFGAFGAAIATVIGFVVEWVISYIYALKVVNLPVMIRKIVFIFLLLIVECLITIIYNVNYYYLIADTIIIMIIVFFMRKELIDIISRFITFAKKH